MRNIFIVIVICFFGYSSSFSQTHEEVILKRYIGDTLNYFTTYLASNLRISDDQFGEQGVLLAGMVLEANGNLKEVFCFNTLHPEFDSHVLDIFQNSQGKWLPDSINGKTEVFVIPIVVTDGKLDYKIDRENFKIPIFREVTVKYFGLNLSEPESMEFLQWRFDRLLKREKFEKAHETLLVLLQREPLNLDYLTHMINLCSKMGDVETASNVRKFVEAYFKNYPEISGI